MTISNDSARSTLIDHNGVTATYNYTFQEPDSDNIAVYARMPDTAEVQLSNPTDFTVVADDDSVGGTVTLVSPTAWVDGTLLRIVRETPRTQARRITNSGGFYPSVIEAIADQLTRIAQETRDLSDRSLAIPHTSTTRYDAAGNQIENLADPTEAQDAATRAWVLATILAEQFDPGVVTISSFSAGLLAETVLADWLTGLGVSPYWQAVLDDVALSGSLASMGFSTKVQDLLALDTDEEILTELGFTAIAQTLREAADAEAARSTLEVPQQIPEAPIFLNRDFQVWQNGVAFNGASSNNDDDSYFADQWKLLSDGDDIVDIAKSISDVPSGARSSAVITQQVDNTKWGIWQTIESSVALPLGGKRVSLSIDIKAPNDLKQFRMMLCEWEGTADSISTSDPILNWNAALVSPSLGTDWALVAGSEFTITVLGTGWERFTLEDVVLPASPNNLAVFFCVNDLAYTAGAVVRLSKVDVVESRVATPFRTRSYADELRAAQRFFVSTFPFEVAPTANVGDEEGALSSHSYTTNGNRGVSIDWRFPTPMVKAPQVDLYNPLAAGTAWNLEGGAPTKASVLDLSDRYHAAISSDEVVTTVGTYVLHATADGRF